MKNILKFIKSLKFSGVSKLAGAMAAIIGGIYTIALPDKKIIDLDLIYQSNKISTSIILVAISLIAIGLLSERGVLKDRFEKKSLNDILPQIKDNASFSQTIPITTKEIWLCGISFMGTISTNRDLIIKLLETNKVNIKILLCPKTGPAYEQALVFFPDDLSENNLLDRLNYSHSQLLRWSSKYKSLQVKTFKTLPTHNLVVVDPTDNLKIQIQPFVFNTDPKKSPLMTLTDNEHKEIFAAYKKGFSDLWGVSEDLK